MGRYAEKKSSNYCRCCCFFCWRLHYIQGGGGGKRASFEGRSIFVVVFLSGGWGRRSRDPRIDSFCGVLWVVEILISIQLVICFLKFWSISTFSLEVDDYTPQKSNLHHETLKNMMGFEAKLRIISFSEKTNHFQVDQVSVSPGSMVPPKGNHRS